MIRTDYSAMSAYQTAAGRKTAAEINTAAQTAASQAAPADTVELSGQGMAALTQTGSTAQQGKSYDLDQILQLHAKSKTTEGLTKAESDTYWAARASDPQLDASLYAADKADALNFVGKVQTILMKLRTGQKLTPQEQKMVDDDPMLQQAGGQA